MNKLLLSFVLLSTFAFIAESLSCCAGRAGCIGSCNLQNCATGYCTKEGCDGVCQCSRCDKGSIGSVGIGRRKREVYDGSRHGGP
ncbi:hypothetical protein L596_028540 [Steinernema carpocapsae]|uniref:Uncharacterized protein n=1 Tax=Steinernema carpocapsae TaxID=34508 RepID=A0A4U5LYQ2_STECR|nr:hypothetical protein L596_028540 [Steinernema carpocapsae]